jgi:hypothetical protein
VESQNGNYHAFEFKWNEKKKVKSPPSFQKSYPGATFKVVNRKNFTDFVQ